MCHKVSGGCGAKRSAPIENPFFSPEAPRNNQQRNPGVDDVKDEMVGARAKPRKVAKPVTPDLAERVQGIISDFVDKVKKAMPSNPPAVTPR